MVTLAMVVVRMVGMRALSWGGGSDGGAVVMGVR